MPSFTTYDGTELAYDVRGEGEPLVCLPGGPMRDAAYLGELGGLAAYRRLIVLDLRGTGASAEPADPASYRCDRQVADVEALRRHLGLERIDLLGHSAAGNLATLYAAAHPERVSSLVLVTPGTRAVGIEITDEEWDKAGEVFADEPWYADARAALATIGPDTPVARVMELAAPFAYGRWDEAARAHAAAITDQAHWDAAAAYYAPGAFDPEATRAALSALTAPVLILAGEYDGGPSPARAAELAAFFPNAELVVQARAGHFPWVDDAGAFARSIAAFLDPEVRTVTVDGVRLAYRVWGEEAAPPVVLVHGRGGNSADWARIAGDLAADHRVYAVDLRGHGLSDWTVPYGFDVFRDELRGFLKELDLAGADVVAHSMGGAAAYLLAMDEPGLIGRLVLEEAPVFFPLDPPRGRAARPEGPLGLDWDVVLATDAQLNVPDPAWREGLAAITAPTLVVAGGEISHLAQERLSWMADHIPAARLVTIDTGHEIHASRPADFLVALREFGI
ncbi:alpha/beta fold hydrolase [Streptomyces sp. P9(2023)]|uniref:alpha/beta fold hydrolase n=1 Tax=Streptomyces sp. P9(2023) TaxID=3064394 RepID=UPI0028F436CD|nr:alpha/beta fold hydrolase [Streptomyces sp. P9(2023)]MDT9689076.1 alpha/beta fold hydrolase [Streptomyces sp. P9(2023)]